nr:hypothetical protein [Spirochaetales bacterium]
MKKICTIVFFVMFFGASMAFGDEVDKELSNMATEHLKASTRQMISSGINKDDAIKMTRSMLENHFAEEHVVKAHEIIMNALEKGLPVKSIMSKAAEGMAKQVQDRNIVQAMENVRSRYAFAYEQAKGITQEEAQISVIGNSVAECLEAGMNNEDVSNIMHSLHQRTQQTTNAETVELTLETVNTAKDMARLGVSSKAATDVVRQALQHDYSAKEMMTIKNSFMTHSRHSSPNSLAENYSNAIEHGKSAESLGGGSGSGSGSGSGGGDGGGSGGGDGGGSGGGSG